MSCGASGVSGGLAGHLGLAADVVRSKGVVTPIIKSYNYYICKDRA